MSWDAKSYLRCKIAPLECDISEISRVIIGFDILNCAEQEEMKQQIERFRKEKARLNIAKSIDDMTDSELKHELKIRDLMRNEKYWILLREASRDNLKRYLNYKWCKDYREEGNKLLLVGYCKMMDKKYNMNLPFYLVQIMLNYYPTFSEYDKNIK